MFGVGTVEALVIGLVAVLLFGNRLPGVARSLGKGFNEFKKGLHSDDGDSMGDRNAPAPQ